jgi:DNA primase
MERGFDPATLEYLGVGYCNKGLHTGRVAIPIHNREGSLVAYVGCSVEDGSYLYPKNFHQEAELYSLRRVLADGSPTDSVLLVTDFFDVFRLHEAGYPNTIALMGETMSPWQAQSLTEAFPEGTTLRLFGERQSNWALQIIGRLLHSFSIYIVWPERNGIRPQAKGLFLFHTN